MADQKAACEIVSIGNGFEQLVYERERMYS